MDDLNTQRKQKIPDKSLRREAMFYVLGVVLFASGFLITQIAWPFYANTPNPNQMSLFGKGEVLTMLGSLCVLCGAAIQLRKEHEQRALPNYRPPMFVVNKKKTQAFVALGFAGVFGAVLTWTFIYAYNLLLIAVLTLVFSALFAFLLPKFWRGGENDG